MDGVWDCIPHTHIYVQKHTSRPSTRTQLPSTEVRASASRVRAPCRLSHQHTLLMPCIGTSERQRQSVRVKKQQEHKTQIMYMKVCEHYKCCVFCACIMIGNWLLWQEHEHESDGKTNLFIFYIYYMYFFFGLFLLLLMMMLFGSDRFRRFCVYENCWSRCILRWFVFALVKNISARLRMCLFASLAILINSSLIEEVWVCFARQ